MDNIFLFVIGMAICPMLSVLEDFFPYIKIAGILVSGLLALVCGIFGVSNLKKQRNGAGAILLVITVLSLFFTIAVATSDIEGMCTTQMQQLP